jgi:hypothetical protein
MIRSGRFTVGTLYINCHLASARCLFQDGGAADTEDRATVRVLREMAGEELQLPDELVPPEYRAAVIAWLVRRATCPIRYVWGDLGPYFWPRWVRRGECLHDAGKY